MTADTAAGRILKNGESARYYLRPDTSKPNEWEAFTVSEDAEILDRVAEQIYVNLVTDLMVSVGRGAAGEVPPDAAEKISKASLIMAGEYVQTRRKLIEEAS